MKKNTYLIMICILFIITVVITAVISNNKKNSDLSNNDNNNTEITTDDSDSLYEMITNVNCDNTLVFDFNDKDTISTTDFNENQKLNLIFRYFELNDELDSITIDNFNTAVKYIFGPNYIIEFNFESFRYKNYIYSTNNNKITKEETDSCEESNIVTKNFSYSVNEVGIELGKKDSNKLYDMNNNLVGEYSNTIELNALLDESTAYSYIYEFNNNEPYLIEVKPIIKLKLEE